MRLAPTVPGSRVTWRVDDAGCRTRPVAWFVSQYCPSPAVVVSPYCPSPERVAPQARLQKLRHRASCSHSAWRNCNAVAFVASSGSLSREARGTWLPRAAGGGSVGQVGGEVGEAEAGGVGGHGDQAGGG